MQQHQHDLETTPLFLIHEGLTPAALREIYPDSQVTAVNPLMSLFNLIKNWCAAQLNRV